MRTMTSPNGHTVLVGQTARENETVSFELARSGDHWFHAHAVPGAHVVLQKVAGVVGPEDLAFAADLAAAASKGHTHSRVAVDHAMAIDVVRPPKGRGRTGTVAFAKDACVTRLHGVPGRAPF